MSLDRNPERDAHRRTHRALGAGFLLRREHDAIEASSRACWPMYCRTAMKGKSWIPVSLYSGRLRHDLTLHAKPSTNTHPDARSFRGCIDGLCGIWEALPAARTLGSRT